MKRFLTLLALPLVLAACGTTDVSYKMSFDTQDSSQVQALTATSLRVIERRLDRMNEALEDRDIAQSDTGSTITLSVSSEDIANQLTYELTQPFSVRFMKEVPAGQGVLSVEGHGDFADTVLKQADLLWAEAAEDSSGKGAVRLIFKEEGRTKLTTVLKENMGKSIGIFVRDRLISKLSVKAETVDENIVIRDIPNPELARIFVDDLNVGMHVIFTPLP